jgi:hypothetical protein
MNPQTQSSLCSLLATNAEQKQRIVELEEFLSGLLVAYQESGGKAFRADIKCLIAWLLFKPPTNWKMKN